MTSVILMTAARVLTPLMLVFSLHLLVRGHNDPGGGFVGGLVAASAFMLYAVAHGVAAARRLLRFGPLELASAGMLVAAAAGVPALAQGAPFLSSVWLITEPVAIGSPTLFDLGVYLVVVGAVSGVLLALEGEL